MLTIASIPAAHPYVVSITDAKHVRLLADPTPLGATLPGQWWPPRLLEPDYLRRRLDEIDVVHVHFGFDASAPADLAEVAESLARRRIPLVVTVHDLQNPHFADQTVHNQHLDVLIPAATTVVTLTDGAADEIGRRWNRNPVVVPHPHVLPLEAIGVPRTPRARPVVGIHAKDLRANVDPWPLLDQMIDDDSADHCLRLDFDEGVTGAPRAAEASPEVLDRYRRAGVDVRVHHRFSDQEMSDYLTEVDVLVLPYRHGTHSGWVEACHDAGVRAVVPDCGYFHRQHDDLVFGYGSDRFDPASLDSAVRAAVRSAWENSTGADHDRRLRRAEQRRRVQDATSSVYRQALDGDHAAGPGWH